MNIVNIIPCFVSAVSQRIYKKSSKRFPPIIDPLKNVFFGQAPPHTTTNFMVPTLDIPRGCRPSKEIICTDKIYHKTNKKTFQNVTNNTFKR